MASKSKKPVAKVKGRGKTASKKAVVKRVAKVLETPVRKRKTRTATGQRVKLFVGEYLKANFNGAKAAVACGYSPMSARFIASELLATAEVQEMLTAAIKARAERLDIDTDDVLKRLYSIATADPRELIGLEYGCCRYCWGKDNRYQWTQRQLNDAIADYTRQVMEAGDDREKVSQIQKPDKRGGIGFNPNNDPNPKCPECFGNGDRRIVPKDTRDLSPGALLLYAGVKETQHGLEIKMHDQKAALIDVGRHMGMFEQKVKHSGNVGVHQTVSDLLEDIDGAGTGLPAHANRGD
jgi:phage terminase small subunit